MLFVHVVTGPDLLVTVAQIEGQVGITFQIRGRRNFVERCERKYFAADFEDKNVVAEWRALSCIEFAEAILPKRLQIHRSEIKKPSRRLHQSAAGKGPNYSGQFRA